MEIIIFVVLNCKYEKNGNQSGQIPTVDEMGVIFDMYIVSPFLGQDGLYKCPIAFIQMAQVAYMKLND